MSFFRTIALIDRFRIAAAALVLLFALDAGAQQTPVVESPRTGKIDHVAQQAALVTEFDVNGMKVLVKRRAASPTFAGGIFFRGGVRNFTDKNAGIENLTLSAAVEAGRKYPRQTLRRELARMGAGITAASTRDFSVVTFAGTRENFDRIWDITADVLIDPLFAPADVERVKSLVLTGLREAEGVPDSALEAAQDRTLYAGHPYAVDPDGTVATVSPLSAADLRTYHRKLLETSRILIVVVGDVNPELLRAKLTESFARVPRGDFKETPLPALDFSRSTVDVTSRAIATNYIRGSFAAPSLRDPDYHAMRVATNILQQLVFEEVRAKRQLSYAPNAEMNMAAVNTGFIYATAVRANETVNVMLQQIRFLQESTLRAEVLAEIAGSFLTDYYVNTQTNAAQAGELARWELIGGGWRNSFEFLNRIREVKPSDIQAVSRKYMRNIRFNVVGDPKAVDAAVFTGTRTTAAGQ